LLSRSKAMKSRLFKFWWGIISVFLITLWWNRNVIVRFLKRTLKATSSTVAASEQLTLALSHASTDLRSYLHPSSSSSSLLSRRNSTNNSSDEVPQSIRRVFKILATPECTSVLRTLAAGAAQAAIREAARSPDDETDHDLTNLLRATSSPPQIEESASNLTTQNRRNKSNNNSNTKIKAGWNASLAGKVFFGLQTPGGERLAVALVSAAVREAIFALTTAQQHESIAHQQMDMKTNGHHNGFAVERGMNGSTIEGQSCRNESVSQVRQVLEVLCTESGKELVREVVGSAVRTAIVSSVSSNCRDGEDGNKKSNSMHVVLEITRENPALIKDLVSCIVKEAVREFLFSRNRVYGLNESRKTRTEDRSTNENVDALYEIHTRSDAHESIMSSIWTRILNKITPSHCYI